MHLFIDGGLLTLLAIVFVFVAFIAGTTFYLYWIEDLQGLERLDLSDYVTHIEPTPTPFLLHCTLEGARIYTAEEINEFARNLERANDRTA